MEIVDFPQRSPEWHSWRREGVSASDASIILDRSPYKTVWRLWAEKVGKALPDDLSSNPHVLRGINNEDIGRQIAERVLYSGFLFPVCAQSSTHPFIRASFDGLDDNNRPVEIKCPSQSQWDQVVLRGAESELYQLYYPQVQQQIYVADHHEGVLFVLSPDNNDYRYFVVKRDDQLINEIISAAIEFMEWVDTKKPPPFDKTRDLFVPTDPVVADLWMTHAYQYRSLDYQIKQFENDIKKLVDAKQKVTQELVNLMGDFLHAEAAGVAITRYAVSGSVDYDAVFNQFCPQITESDLDRFRKPPTMRVRSSSTDIAMPRGIIDPDIKDIYLSVLDGPIVSSYF